MHTWLKSAVLSAAGAALFASVPASAATVAYYRFEDGTNGEEVSTSTTGGVGSQTVDGGGDGSNGMVAWNNVNSPNYSSSTLPTTPFANTMAMQFDDGDDLYQASAATSTLATTAFTNFTVETYVNFNTLAGWNTFVGRDDSGNPGQGPGGQSLFYLAEAGGPVGSGVDNGFRVELITATNTNVQVNSTFVPALNTWYHVAAVGDATAGTLTLYVDGVSVGSTTGFTGLKDPSPDTSWSIGRGQFNNSPGDKINGYLDEVRFSDAALDPSQFLNAVPEPASMALFTLGMGLILVRRR